MFSHTRSILSGLAVAALICSPLQADFVTIPQPDAAYLGSTALIDFTDNDYTLVGALAGGGEVLVYDNFLEEHTVPANWVSWNHPPSVETATPRVGFTDGASSLTINLSEPAIFFGLEIEPDDPQSEETTAAFYSGSTLVGAIERFPNGHSGALLYAARSSTDPFTRIVISNSANDDFAIARQRFSLAAAAIPEPAPLGLGICALVCGIARFGLFKRRAGVVR